MNVLIVDDDPVVRQILSAILQEHAVELLTSGQACLERVRGESPLPEVIFLDVQLQDIPGTEVLREIRKTSVGRVVVLSGNSLEEVREIDPTFCPDFFLQKPFTAAEVNGALEAIGLGSTGD